jgi:hypothetical protein
MTAEDKFYRELFPYTNSRMEEAKEAETRFVHYTSAQAALSIIQNETVWMRSAEAMNDFSEVEHGRRCLQAAWNHEVHGNKFKSLLNSVQSGLDRQFEQLYSARLWELFRETFLISISEHGNSETDENQFGRLSMWRAYGGNTNVAFVFNNGPFLREGNATNAFTSPVLYCDNNSFCEKFASVVANFEENLDIARDLGPEYVLKALQSAFNFATLSAKHKGFSEEKEWRVIYSPTLYPSEKISFDLEVVSGVPQRVYKFPLKNFPEEGHYGVTLPELLEEIIIGPTTEGYLIFDALVRALTEQGVENAASKVKISDIPLRR